MGRRFATSPEAQRWMSSRPDGQDRFTYGGDDPEDTFNDAAAGKLVARIDHHWDHADCQDSRHGVFDPSLRQRPSPHEPCPSRARADVEDWLCQMIKVAHGYQMIVATMHVESGPVHQRGGPGMKSGTAIEPPMVTNKRQLRFAPTSICFRARRVMAS